MHTGMLLILSIFGWIAVIDGGILYPRASESRELLSLDGIWRFSLANMSRQNQGFENRWFSKHLQEVLSLNVVVSHQFERIIFSH